MAANNTSFKKGDPRINRNGRPKSFDALRKLAQQIAHEEAQAGGKTVVINGKKATVAEMVMRQWAASKDPRLQKTFIEIAFGKVPDAVEVSGKLLLKAYETVSPDDWDKEIYDNNQIDGELEDGQTEERAISASTVADETVEG